MKRMVEQSKACVERYCTKWDLDSGEQTSQQDESMPWSMSKRSQLWLPRWIWLEVPSEGLP